MIEKLKIWIESNAENLYDFDGNDVQAISIEDLIERINSLPSQAPDGAKGLREGNQCEAGCIVFTGGERRHDKNCVHYPESRTKMYDDLLVKFNDLKQSLTPHPNSSEQFAGLQTAQSLPEPSGEEIREGQMTITLPPIPSLGIEGRSVDYVTGNPVSPPKAEGDREFNEEGASTIRHTVNDLIDAMLMKQMHESASFYRKEIDKHLRSIVSPPKTDELKKEAQNFNSVDQVKGNIKPNASENHLITEANSIIRSFNTVIERKGEDTNWEALDKKVKRILKEQYEYMYPKEDE